VARQPDSSWDAIMIDAFVAATVPRALITVQALADAARVAPLTVVNVVENRAARDVRTVAAGLAASYPRVWTLGARAGNTVVVGTVPRLDLDRIAARAAADPSPARLLVPDELAAGLTGTVPLRDEGVGAGP
jgi:hypothetical protein